jgi:hypothetical protein
VNWHPPDSVKQIAPDDPTKSRIMGSSLPEHCKVFGQMMVAAETIVTANNVSRAVCACDMKSFMSGLFVRGVKRSPEGWEPDETRFRHHA